MTEPIIVVGPGRCGTSCVAGVLHHLGVFMGERLLGAHPTNPHGHWEDCEFLDLNVALLRQGLTRLQWAEGIQQLVEKRRARGIPWGWKDPRTCDLLRNYLEFFNDPKFVRCVRDPALIEASVVKAYGGNGWTPADAHAMRVRRERELDRYLPWYKTLEVDFEQLRANREETVRSLLKFCELDDVKEATLRSAIQFIQPTPRPQKVAAMP